MANKSHQAPSQPAASTDAILITPAQLRERWSVSEMWLWRARRAGRLAALKLGKHTRYLLADVEAFERDSQA
jgi:hypothetical protein